MKWGKTMTVFRDEIEVAANHAAGRREWVRPALQRISAGSAEVGAVAGPTDIGVSYS
jgi:hypothetical protein